MGTPKRSGNSATAKRKKANSAVYLPIGFALILLCVSLGGCAGYTTAASSGNDGGAGNSGGGVLTASTDAIGFGNVVEGSTATQSVTVTNTGTGTVNISGVSVSGGVFTIVGGNPSSSLAAGQTASVQVQFAPTSMTPASGTLTITSDATNSSLAIALSGIGLEADPAFSPSALSFSDVPVGETSTQNVTLSNTGNMDLAVSAASLSGTGFSMSGLSLPATIAPNASTTFSVQFSPQTAAGASGSIQFTDNGKHSPHTINLNGNGVAAGSTLGANPGSFDFSNVLVGSSSSKSITLTNSGNKTITIGSITAAGAGFSASGVAAGQTIASGGTATLVASFAPAKAGAASGTVTITSTATNSPLVIALSGTGTQGALSANPASIDFGNVPVGNTATVNVTLTNAGTANVSISTASASGTGFSMSTLSPQTLTPGATATFTVTFGPKAAGSASGNVSIASTAPGSPLAIALTGSGSATQPQISLNPSSVAFGNVNVGSNSSKTVTLTNTGNATLDITAATISGSGYTMNLQPISINAGANTTFNVTFTPTASGSASGSISITSNAPGSPTTVALSGTGLQAQIAATPSSVAFGTVTIGNTNSQPITLTNNGNTTLTFSQISVTGTGFGQTGLSTSTTIAAGASASFNATFDPSSSGASSGSITLKTNGTPSSIVIGLSGTGQTGLSAPTITSATTASAIAGTAFSYQITATNSPTSYGATGLPTGLSVNTTTGLISGTPSAAGTSSVTLSATNGTGTGSATLTLTIAIAKPVITSATTASGTAGTAFSYQITATNSPTIYAASGLPAGLTVDTSTGLISGTPSAADTSSVTLSATNGTGTGTATLTLTIASAAQPQLSVSPASVAFGNVNVGGNSSKTVTLTNTGSATLNITAATIPGSGYTMNLQPVSINAGANTTFTVTFTPAATGSASGSISISSNAPGSPATIALSGTGLQAQISATPSSVAFGAVTIGNTNSQPITLKNNGNTTLTFSQISVTGTGFGQTGLSTSTTIAAGASASFNATFDPASSGAVSGSITLTTNGTPSPLVITLSGTGQAASLLLGASPTGLAFGNVLDQSSKQMTTSVTNNGNANVTISGVTVAGTGFSASGIANGTVLTPGQSATLTVTFAPISGGLVSGAIATITSNATNSPTIIALTGTGNALGGADVECESDRRGDLQCVSRKFRGRRRHDTN